MSVPRAIERDTDLVQNHSKITPMKQLNGKQGKTEWYIN